MILNIHELCLHRSKIHQFTSWFGGQFHIIWLGIKTFSHRVKTGTKSQEIHAAQYSNTTASE